MPRNHAFLRFGALPALAAMLLCSCAEPLRNAESLDVTARATPRLLQRAESFRQATIGCPETGFGVNRDTLRTYTAAPPSSTRAVPKPGSGSPPRPTACATASRPFTATASAAMPRSTAPSISP